MTEDSSLENVKDSSAKLNISSGEAKFLGIYIFAAIILMLLAQVSLDGGMWRGGAEQISAGIAGDYFEGAHIELFKDSATQIILTTLLLLSVFHFKSNPRFDRLILPATLLFGYLLLQLVMNGTKNALLGYLTLVYLTTMFWYYSKNSEIKSYFGNKLVIFSLRRTIAILLMFFAIAAITFFMSNLLGDPVQLATARVRFAKDVAIAVRLRRYGLVDANGVRIPVGVRFFTWIWDSLHGSFGVSYDTLASVSDEIGFRIWETLKMQIIALVIAFSLSIIIGMAAAYYHGSSADSTISAFALLGLSMPIFVSGYIAIFIFGGTGLDLFPTTKAHSLPSALANNYACFDCSYNPGEFWDTFWPQRTGLLDSEFWSRFLKVGTTYFWDALLHLFLPVLTLSFAIMATYSRLTRSTMLEVMRQDYILAARANGISERTILSRHALRNVLLPLITFLGLNIGTLLAGAPITETVFSWPGLGLMFVSAIPVLDIPILMALTMIITIMILMSNLITDIVYTYLDPRLTL